MATDTSRDIHNNPTCLPTQSTAVLPNRRPPPLDSSLTSCRTREMGGLLLARPMRSPSQPNKDWLPSPAKLALLAASLVAVHAFLGHASATPNAHLVREGRLSVVRLARRGFGLGLGASNSLDDGEESASLIKWEIIYAAASPQVKPLICIVMVFWLVFLFAFVGIAASASQSPPICLSCRRRTLLTPTCYPLQDFFCPNLSTIASRLGLSESVVSFRLPRLRHSHFAPSTMLTVLSFSPPSRPALPSSPSPTALPTCSRPSPRSNPTLARSRLAS